MHSPSWGCWQHIRSHLSASWQKWAEGSKSRLRVNIAAFPAAFTAGAAGRAACSPKKDGAVPWHGHPGAALLQSVLLLVGASSEAPGLPHTDHPTPPHRPSPWGFLLPLLLRSVPAGAGRWGRHCARADQASGFPCSRSLSLDAALLAAKTSGQIRK